MLRYETDSRYYLCTAQRDLFGQWEVWRAWGAKGSRLGNSMRQAAPDEATARRMLDAVVATRLAHAYVLSATGGEGLR